MPAGLSTIRFCALQAREIVTVLMDRYGGPVPDDDAGRDDLRLALLYVSQTGNGRARAEAFARAWAPWASTGELERLVQEALTSPLPALNADELAQQLGVRMETRQRLGLTTIGACDVDKTERERLRRERRATKAREKRRAIRNQKTLAAARSAATHFGDARSERQAAISTALAGRSWTNVKDLAEIVANWSPFKHLVRKTFDEGLDLSVVRRQINRDLDEMRERGQIENDLLVTANAHVKKRVVRATPATLVTQSCPEDR